MNILKSNRTYDVTVIGAGLAGIRAAVTAAKKGCSVLLCTKSVLCSGSSFYARMDALHCQAPADEADKAIFMQDIAECGYGMNDPAMNRYYADHIRERLAEFPEMGIACKKLPEPKLACFARHPHSLYSWTGWPEIRARLRGILSRTPGITVRERTEAAAVVTDEGSPQGREAKGVLLFDRRRQAFEYVECPSLILATGGFGALYKHNLNSPDVSGDGQVLALEAGAELMNLEFDQFIPGWIEPVYKIVFREGTLDYCSRLTDRNGTEILRELLPDPGEYAGCLRLRAAHGPFTSADLSRCFDIALMKACLNDRQAGGAEIRYSPEINRDTRSYIAGYREWLQKTHHVDLGSAGITIAPFFQAANGGIFVDHRCETGVKGLFACGEAAGGIHGADRLGGNATGSCLVFGHLAAESACARAGQARHGGAGRSEAELRGLLEETYGSAAGQSRPPREILEEVKQEMWRHANVLRTGDGLTRALSRVRRLRGEYNALSFFETPEQIPAAMQAHRFLILSEAVLAAMLRRRESRGAHYREDYPRLDPAFRRRTVVSLQNGAAVCENERR